MSFDEIFDLTAGVYFNFYNIYTNGERGSWLYPYTAAYIRHGTEQQSCYYTSKEGGGGQGSIHTTFYILRIQHEAE